MCGFTGIAARERGAGDPSGSLEPLLRRMSDTIAHRGPDDGTTLARGRLGIGFRRLAIIDVDGGRQPIWNETEDVAVVCNGEIYNFLELRAGLEARGHRFRTGSDVETIVHLYEEEGPALVRRLVGMFAIAILDWRGGRERLVLARDRLGIKPLYFARTDGGLVYGSEPKALLASGFLPRRLRGEALLEYLVAGYTSGPRAAWEGMERLPPASTLVHEAGSREAPRIERYWDLPTDSLREPAPAEEILELLDRAVRDHLVSDVPLGAFLSGGIDSNAVLDSMARARAIDSRATRSVRERLLACTVGFREEEFDEVASARETAATLGAEHHTAVLDADPKLALDVLPWIFDEPLADPSTLPTYLVAKMARERVTVALSGDGGDEVFAGYRRYVFDVAEHRVRAAIGRTGTRLLGQMGKRYPKLDWAPRALRAKSTLLNLGADPAHAYWSSLTQLSREEAVSILEPGLARALAESDPFDAFEEHYNRPRVDDPLYRAQYADFHHFLPDRILVKSDRAAMGSSLEVRPPLLDHRLVERFANLPAREKVRAGRGKYALREALRSRLPARVLDGPKRGFDIPLAAWTRGPLGPAVEAAVEGLPARWFDRAALRERLAEHRSGLVDHAHLLWSLLVLERWRLRHGVEEVAA